MFQVLVDVYVDPELLVAYGIVSFPSQLLLVLIDTFEFDPYRNRSIVIISEMSCLFVQDLLLMSQMVPNVKPGYMLSKIFF
jgi:hypothetical protein